MSLENTELNIGGVKLRGVYIALLVTIISTISGGIWTASGLYSRLEALEAQEIPNIEPLKEDISLLQQQAIENGVPELQGKLAQLGTNLNTIVDQQQELLGLQNRIVEMEKKVTEMETSVQKGELVVEDLGAYKQDIDRLKREVEELWEGMDYLANPLN